jgi:hypothetical protein
MMAVQDKVQGWKLVEELTAELMGLDLQSPALREELADRLEAVAQHHREIARVQRGVHLAPSKAGAK